MPNRRFWAANDTASFPPPTSVLVHDIAEGQFELGAYITMSIIGFNDNFVIPLKNGTNLKGGFILRSGYGYSDHSYKYFLSALTPYQEAQVCPAMPDPAQWPLPANCSRNFTFSCQVNGSLNLTCEPIVTCVGPQYCVFGDDYVWHADDTLENLRTCESIAFRYPREYAAHAFVPKGYVRDHGLCGYAFIPYAVVDTIVAAVPGSFAFDAVDVVVQFTDASYASSKGSRDYAALSRSTFTFHSPVAEYPFDNLSSGL
jgi:hypothetical protein